MAQLSFLVTFESNESELIDTETGGLYPGQIGVALARHYQISLADVSVQRVSNAEAAKVDRLNIYTAPGS